MAQSNGRMALPQAPVSNSKHPFIQAEFNEIHRYIKPTKPSFKQTLRERLKCRPRRTLYHLFPAAKWIPKYKWKEDFTHDLVSGITVAIMHIPQGMAYALLGGVAPIVGIYMAFFPVLIYVLMGTSRHISMGTFAVVCMMTSNPVMHYSQPSLPTNETSSTLSPSPWPVGIYSPIEIATAVCFVVGIWQILLGVFKLGILSVLFSEMLVSGFTTGAAVHVITSQVKNILGLQITRFNGPLKIIYTYIEVTKNIGQSNLVAVGISAVTITLLFLYNEFIKPRISKKIPIPIPTELIAVITGTLVSMAADLNEKYSVTTVGDIPTGLPFPAIPAFPLMPLLLVDGFLISIVAFAVNVSMASMFSRKLDYAIHANQELIASGCGNVFGSFFSCMPFAASLSRSVIQQTVGGRTQLASVVSCMLLLLILLLIGPFFEPLPNCILASIVIVALKSMLMQVTQFPSTWRKSRLDGLVWLGTFSAVVLVDIEIGLAIGIGLSILSILVLGQTPELARLGLATSNVDTPANVKALTGPTLYLEVQRYQTAIETAGICVIKMTGGLHFANCDPTVKRIRKLMYQEYAPITNVAASAVNQASTNRDLNNEMDTLMRTPPPNIEPKEPFCLILDMSSVCFVDPSARKALLHLYDDFKKKSMIFCLAATTVTIYEQLETNEFPISILFASVTDAVLFAQQSNDDTILS